MSLWGNKDTATVAGTIGIPNGSATVTGVSTTFGTDVLANDALVIAGVKYRVKSIASTTALTLTSNYEGTTIASGETITKQQAPKYLNLADLRNTVFVSQEETALKTNKDKGITGAGWWLVTEHKDNTGANRYNAECLVAASVANSVSGDAADDTIVADAEITITIGTQPTAQSSVSGAATFAVTASVNTGTVTYQWQRALAATPTRFANVSGATSASLVLSGVVTGDTGNLYRVVLSSTTGAVKVNSTAVALTFGS